MKCKVTYSFDTQIYEEYDGNQLVASIPKWLAYLLGWLPDLHRKARENSEAV